MKTTLKRAAATIAVAAAALLPHAAAHAVVPVDVAYSDPAPPVIYVDGQPQVIDEAAVQRLSQAVASGQNAVEIGGVTFRITVVNAPGPNTVFLDDRYIQLTPIPQGSGH